MGSRRVGRKQEDEQQCGEQKGEDTDGRERKGENNRQKKEESPLLPPFPLLLSPSASPSCSVVCVPLLYSS
jgi:hypothetical protein